MSGSDPVVPVDVHLMRQPHPTSAQQAAWEVLWRRLLTRPEPVSTNDDPPGGHPGGSCSATDMDPSAKGHS
jgi:hypothetical protein